MKTRIIVDSTADLMPEFKSRVHIVPLSVNFGDEEYIDGVTIDHKTFYEKQEFGASVKDILMYCELVNNNTCDDLFEC